MKFRPDVGAVSGGGTKSVCAGAGVLAHPRTGARSSVSSSVAGGDNRKERFLGRFLPEQKAANNEQRTAESTQTTLVRTMIRTTPGVKLPKAKIAQGESTAKFPWASTRYRADNYPIHRSSKHWQERLNASPATIR